MNPMDLKRGIDKAVVAAVAELQALSTPLCRQQCHRPGRHHLRQPDEKVGKLIAEAMDKVGRDGVITVEDGQGLDDELAVVEGMQFDRGYPPFFVNKPETGSVELDDPSSCWWTRKSPTSAKCCRCWKVWPRRANR